MIKTDPEEEEKMQDFQKAINILDKNPDMRAQSDINFLSDTLDSFVQKFMHELGVSEDVMMKCWRVFMHRIVRAGANIITFGDIGDEFFVLLEGKASIWMPLTQEKWMTSTEAKSMKARVGKDIYDLKEMGKPEVRNGIMQSKFEVVTMKQQAFITRGNSFGEMAIQKNIPRTASVVAEEKCHLATLSRLHYKKTIEQVQRRSVNEKVGFLMKVPLLSRLGKEYLTKSHYFIKLASFQRGELVFNEGDSVDKIYIIKKGVFNIEKKVQTDISSDGTIELSYVYNSETGDRKRLISENPELKSLIESPMQSQYTLNVSVSIDTEVFGIEDALSGLKTRAFHMHCISHTAEVYCIPVTDFLTKFYPKTSSGYLKHVGNKRLEYLQRIVNMYMDKKMKQNIRSLKHRDENHRSTQRYFSLTPRGEKGSSLTPRGPGAKSKNNRNSTKNLTSYKINS